MNGTCFAFGVFSCFLIAFVNASSPTAEPDTKSCFSVRRCGPMKLPDKRDDDWILKGKEAPQRLSHETLNFLQSADNKPRAYAPSLDADLKAIWERLDTAHKYAAASQEADLRREWWEERFATEQALFQNRLPYPYLLWRTVYSGKAFHGRIEDADPLRCAPKPITFTSLKKLRLEAEEREKRITHLFNTGVFTRYQDPVFCPRPRKTIPLLPREEVVATLQDLLRAARHKERPVPPLLPPLKHQRSLQNVFEKQSLQNGLAEKEAVARSQQVFSKPKTRAHRAYAVGVALEGVQLGITAWHLMEEKRYEAATYLREAKINPLLSAHDKLALLDKAEILWRDLLFFEDVDLGPFLCPLRLWSKEDNHEQSHQQRSNAPLFQNPFQAPDAGAGCVRFYLLTKKIYDQKEDFFQSLNTKENPVNPKRLPIITVRQMLREVQTCANLQANTFVPKDEDYFARLNAEITTSRWQTNTLRRHLEQRIRGPLVSFTLTDPTPLPLEEWIFMQKTKEPWKEHVRF
ncbi:MAG: hypothetical protein ACK5TR_06535 [Alphaproteobacteria bacterium]|jgi:hypothetical protein|nr:hypothetical protein [Alphaproteobacteria bacterium]